MNRERAFQSAAAYVEQPHRHSDGPDVLTQKAICLRLGVSDETWRRWVKAGRAPQPLEGFPLRRPRWRREDVDQFCGQSSSRFIAPRHTAESGRFRVVRKADGASR